jgi:DNA-binding NtrC family response regulator
MNPSILVFAPNPELSFGLRAEPASANPRSPTLEARVDQFERQIIAETLVRHNFRRKETAAELGISRVTLYNKMKKFGLM